MTARGGEAIRCVVRIARSELGYADATEGGSVFIAGNALELVPPDKAEGERHTLSRIFDPHASDQDVWESEGKPMIDSVVAGENVSMVLAGHMRSGRDALFGAMASLSMEELFEAMHLRQKNMNNAAAIDPTSDGAGGIDFTVIVRYVSVTPGDPNNMTDLLSAGSSSVHCTVDPAAPIGVQLRGVTQHVISSQSELNEALKTARSRLRAHRPPAPSSVLLVELRQGRKGSKYARNAVAKEGGADAAAAGLADLISTLMIFDIEAGALGDPLSNGLRQLLSGPNSASANFVGPTLLLRDSIGGNTRTLLLGTLRPADHPESEATLRLVAGGAGFSNFPLINDRRTRGLLAHHRWVSSQLQEQLSIAEGRLQHGVDQLQEDRKALPNQLHGATARLQGLVDQLQRDAAGRKGEREKLMAELLELRAGFNAANGELITLKEELIAEKKEKVALSRELIETQLANNEEASARTERMFKLESEAIAATDVLKQLQEKAVETETELERLREALAKATTSAETSALEAAELRAQATSLRSEALEAREREDELSLELLNQSNARAAAEANAADLEARLAAQENETVAQRSRAEASIAEAESARAEALELAEEVSQLKLSIEKQALALQKDRLALQRSAVETAEAQLSRVQEAEARAEAVGRARAEAERQRDDGALRASTELGEMREVEAALRQQLSEHAAQVEALQRHIDLIGKAKEEGTVSDEDREAALEKVRKLKSKEVKEALAERGFPVPEKGKRDQLLRTLEEAVLADLEATAKRRAEEAEAVAATSGGGTKQALMDELMAYERRVNATLEVNRGLVEAYWRLRAIAGEDNLPSHAEVLGEVSVDRATGRRAVMTELEKMLAREKEAAALQVEKAQKQATEAQAALIKQARETQDMLKRQQASIQEAVQSREQEAAEHEAKMKAAEEATKASSARIAELEARVTELTEQLVETNQYDEKKMLKELVESNGTDELELESYKKAVKKLEEEKAALAARLEEADTMAAPPFATKPGEYEAVIAERNAQLRELKWKVAEHTQSEAALERERTEMKRRAFAAEDQLAELQRYLSVNIARYQKEILRLREMLKAKGVSASGAPLGNGAEGGDIRGEPGALRGEAGLLPREGRLLPKDQSLLPTTGR